MSQIGRSTRLVGAVLAMFALALGMWASGPAFSAQRDANDVAVAAEQANGRVKTAADSAVQRIAPSLRSASGQVDVTIFHNIAAKDALLKIAPTLYTRGYVMPDGSTVSVGKVDATTLLKLAGAAGVESIVPNNINHPAVIGKDGATPTNTKPSGTNSLLVAGIEPQAAVQSDGYGKSSGTSASPDSANDWFDAYDEHNAAAAWENGYDGAGVIVAVVDSGADFGHPDLQTTFARINGGVYGGWPFMYDDYSTQYWEQSGNAVTNSNWNAGLRSLYVDTSRTINAPLGITTTAVITVPNGSRTGAAVGHTYTLPTTSKSGIVHSGFHPDATLGLYWSSDGTQPAIAVVDETTAGVYNTVYVDLDNDHDFTNDVAMSKERPVAALDWNNDGIADESGGLLFWIADGTHGNPGSYIWSDTPRVAGAGNLVAFMISNEFDIDPGGGAHGQECISQVVAQGVTGALEGTDGSRTPSYKPAGTGGMVHGMARNAKVAVMKGVYQTGAGDINSNLYAAMGADGVANSGDEAQISSNSYGSTNIDNDGWDDNSRLFAQINYTINANFTIFKSSGNYGPGYGTQAPSAANTMVIVGASTTSGSTANYFDEITSTAQILWGDVQGFSSRGAVSNGRPLSVTGNGAWGAGLTPLNESLNDGRGAWLTWGGTSRSTPLAAGVGALVVDAFREKNNRTPTYSEVRNILMSTANDSGSDVFAQGAGSVDALRATNAASGHGGVIASPSFWQPGSFNGTHYGQDDSFINLMAPGSSYSGVISITNSSATSAGVGIAATMLQVSSIITAQLTTTATAESPGSFQRPDYLPYFLSPASIPADADLMVVQAVYPFEQFNPTLAYNTPSNQLNTFRLLALDWTDVNNDGNLWTDTNGNGVVNDGEIDRYEWNRYQYNYPRQTALEVSVNYPAQRTHDGIFISLQHRDRGSGVAKTNMTLRITFYKEVAWPWLNVGASSATIGANGTYGLNVTANVPAGTHPGLYEGRIKISPAAGVAANSLGLPDETTTQIPVVIVVAPNSASFDFGGEGRQTSRYDNNVVWGYNDWSGSQANGDWRYFFANVPASESTPGHFWLVNTTWNNYAVPTTTIPTDIDTYLYGPTADSYSNENPTRFGPYTMERKGGSPKLIGSDGRGTFNTATGTTEEWSSGELTAGLNEIMLRTTNFNGRRVDEPFTGKSGVVSVSPYPATIPQDCSTTLEVQVSSTLAIADLTVRAAGLSQPISKTVSITQDGTYIETFTLTDPALLDVRTLSGGAEPAADVDLFIDYRQNAAVAWQSLAQSDGQDANEQVRQILPAAGEYRIRVEGYSVVPSPGTFILQINNIDNKGQLTISNAPISLQPGQPVTLTVQVNGNLAAGSYQGALTMGPAAAPGAIFVPVTVNSSGPCPFSDVVPSDYFYGPVNWLFEHGAISGYDDGTFRPYNSTTRGQVVKIVVIATGLPLVNPSTATFKDVLSANPFYNVIETAVANGIISGYNSADDCDGAANSPCFKPFNEVTRGQLAKIITLSQDWTIVNNPTPTFVDVPTSNPFYSVIETAYAHGVISGYSCDPGVTCPGLSFRPYNIATRGQIAKIVYLAVTTSGKR